MSNNTHTRMLTGRLRMTLTYPSEVFPDDDGSILKVLVIVDYTNRQSFVWLQ